MVIKQIDKKLDKALREFVAEPPQPQKYTITKKIAKMGPQYIIIIPAVLKNNFKPDMLVKVDIEVLD